MDTSNSKAENLITCPNCRKSFTIKHIKENNRPSHIEGLYCPNCFHIIDKNLLAIIPSKSIISESPTSEIIKAIDNYLIKTQKPYTSLAQANKVISQRNLISVAERHSNKLKNLLEEGQIPHAYQTNTKPKQWRIPLSNNRKIQSKKSVHPIPKRKYDAKQRATLKDWYDSFDEREKKGLKRLFIIIAIVTIILLTYVIPDNRTDFVKSLDKQYIGKEWTDYTYQEFDRVYGPGQALRFEDYRWIYYYPNGNFTIKVSKENNRILEISDGKD